jgi:hypothetical protein
VASIGAAEESADLENRNIRRAAAERCCGGCGEDDAEEALVAVDIMADED